MSLVYLGISAALFSYRVDYKDMLEKEKEARKNDVEKKDAEILKVKGESADRLKNITTLESNIKTLSQDLETARNELNDWKNNSTKLTNDLTALNASYEKLQASLTEQIQKNKELNDSLEKTVADKDNAVKERTTLEEKFLQAQNSIIQLEKNLATLEQQYLVQAKELNQAKIILDDYKRKAPTLLTELGSPKVVEGKITAISDKPDLNIVMISVGKNDGVEVGMRFTVYRADKYVAKVQVEKVEAQWAACFSIKEFQADTIKINDNVTTSPY
jgi:DNA repair exonuclease SbcCD ATPase subunit